MTLSALVPGAAAWRSLASTADAPRATPRPEIEVVMVTVFSRCTESRVAFDWLGPCCIGDCAAATWLSDNAATATHTAHWRVRPFIGAPRWGIETGESRNSDPGRTNRLRNRCGDVTTRRRKRPRYCLFTSARDAGVTRTLRLECSNTANCPGPRAWRPSHTGGWDNVPLTLRTNAWRTDHRSHRAQLHQHFVAVLGPAWRVRREPALFTGRLEREPAIRPLRAEVDVNRAPPERRGDRGIGGVGDGQRFRRHGRNGPCLPGATIRILKYAMRHCD